MIPKIAAPRIVVLKRDRLYGELICVEIKKHWRNAVVQVFHFGLPALEAIQAAVPDVFLTGLNIEDMDGLEHLEPFIERDLRILVVTSRTDTRIFDLLRKVRYDGIYDALEGLTNLRPALEAVMERRPYVSPTFVTHLKKPKNITLDALTKKEQMILSVVGDGSDDHQAAALLGLSYHTVNTHRKAIMAKLNIHQKGELMRYALQEGYVTLTPTSVSHPGFQRQLKKLLEGLGGNGEAKGFA